MDKNFRNYENELVNNTYKRMYREQTLEKKLNYKIYPISNKSYNIEQILPLFDTIIDESDPDTDLPQSIHLLQTYISMKTKFNKDSKISSLFLDDELNNLPLKIKSLYENNTFSSLYSNIKDWDWLYLVAYMHDLGKIMLLNKFHNLPQHFVVGDIYPLGTPFEKSNILYDKNYHKQNKEYGEHHYFDLYEPFCGFEKLNFTISHDYYLYKVLKKTKISDEGLYLIRFHSFYAFHSPRNNIRGYTYYANDKDWKMLPLLKLLQKCDLYSKTRNIPDFNDYKNEIIKLVKKYNCYNLIL